MQRGCAGFPEEAEWRESWGKVRREDRTKASVLGADTGPAMWRPEDHSTGFCVYSGSSRKWGVIKQLKERVI